MKHHQWGHSKSLIVDCHVHSVNYLFGLSLNYTKKRRDIIRARESSRKEFVIFVSV